MSHAAAKAQRALARAATREALLTAGIATVSRELLDQATEMRRRMAGGILTNAIRDGRIKTRIAHKPCCFRV